MFLYSNYCWGSGLTCCASTFAACLKFVFVAVQFFSKRIQQHRQTFVWFLRCFPNTISIFSAAKSSKNTSMCLFDMHPALQDTYSLYPIIRSVQTACLVYDPCSNSALKYSNSVSVNEKNVQNILQYTFYLFIRGTSWICSLKYLLGQKV